MLTTLGSGARVDVMEPGEAHEGQGRGEFLEEWGLAGA